MKLRYSDRVLLESKMEDLRREVDDRFGDLHAQNEVFYRTRMRPLEDAHARKLRVVWFVAGMASSALFVSIIALALHGS